MKKIFGHTLILVWFLGFSFCYNAVDMGASPQSLRETVTLLRQFRLTFGDDTDVPSAVSQNLLVLKHAVRDLILEAAEAKNAIETDPEVLTQRVVQRLESQDIPVGDEYGGYGAIESIELRRSKEYPNWMIATTSLSIPYGSDVSLYLFERNGNSWKHAMSVESNGYKTIREAQGWLSYWVSPPMPDVKPFLVTADISPNSVSVWQALRLKVLRVGDQPDSSFLLAAPTLGYCLDEPYFLSIHSAGFGVIYLGSSVDRELAGWRGVHYIEYSVSGKKASAARTLAIDPYNLMKKWMSNDWSAASKSVSPKNRSIVEQWHKRFDKATWACGLGQIRLGQGLDGDHEKLLAEAGCEKDNANSPSAYVLLAPGPRGFEIVSISEKSKFANESEGYSIYGAGKPGITDPIPLIY